jgi:GrpB-like predicted nucleotidyltransferase (UPF0157 family)
MKVLRPRLMPGFIYRHSKRVDTSILSARGRDALGFVAGGCAADEHIGTLYRRVGRTSLEVLSGETSFSTEVSRASFLRMLVGGIEKREIVIADYDPLWPLSYARHAKVIAKALGEKVLSVHHVGSTSVPGLSAKPIVDILAVVDDSSNEAAYLPALVTAGYVLRVREPGWHEHRMFRTPELDVHIHVFSRGCAEVDRVLAFRDRLRISADDRALYESVKRGLAQQEWPDMNAYATAKSEVIEQIVARADGAQ